MRWGVAKAMVYGDQNTLQILEHLIVPESQDAITKSHQFRAPPLVRVLFKRVLTAVQLDGELRLWTRKIDNPLPNWVLASKLPEGEAFAQRIPQKTLNIRRFAA